MANTSNIKTIKKRVEAIHPTIDSSLETIKNSLTPYNFLEVNENGFNKSNVLKDLANNFNKVPKSAPIGKIGNDVMGNEVQNAYPATPDMLKPGVSIVDVENPTQLITSNNNSNTIATDRADGNKDIKRWITRSIFKFREEDYGFDRQVYEIPVKLLMEGIVGVDGKHSTTLQEYPYPEEIVMISQKTDKNFIHFLNVQYSDSHYNYYRGKPYNLMIVKDRIDYGSVNANGDGFNYYTSVYTNNVEESLAFYKDGYLYLSMPDKSFGDELLNTLWDCKIIWRKDAPNREFTIQYDAEELKSAIELTTIEFGQWGEATNGLSGHTWRNTLYGNNRYVAIAQLGSEFGGRRSLYSAFSSDGINWTQNAAVSITTEQPISDACFGNGMFVLMTASGRLSDEISDVFIYSSDGINWKQTSSGISKSDWKSFIVGPDKIIAIAYNENPGAIYSTDGINWTICGGSFPGNNATYGTFALYNGNPRYIINNGNDDRVAFSDDGITWQRSESKGGLSERPWKRIAGNNNRFIIVSNHTESENDKKHFAYSDDGGNTWTTYNPSIGRNRFDSFQFVGNRYILSRESYSGNYYDFLYSIDGMSWSELSVDIGKGFGMAAIGPDRLLFPIVGKSDMIKYCILGDPNGISFDKSSNLTEVSGKCHLLNKNTLQSSSINSISNLEKESNPLVTNNSISMGLSNNKGSLYRIPNYTTPYDLTFTDELSWSLTNFPNILIPITNKYQLGLNYITGVYSESSVMKNTLYCSLFDNIIHKADPKIKTTGDSNYPCDKLVTNIDSDSHIIKVIPIYSSNIRTDDNNGSIEVMVYTTKKKYKVIFTVTDSVLSFTTTTISTFNGFEIADVKQISSTKAILITSTYNVYLDVIKEDSQTANPFGLSGAITPYLLSKYNIVGINASKVVSSLADCSNTNKFASGINNGVIDVVINNSKLSGDGKYFINSGRYSIMKDNSDTNYLVHLKEKYTFSSELDAPYSKNFEWRHSEKPGPTNSSLLSVCYGDRKFISIETSQSFISSDGITWEIKLTSINFDGSKCSSICYGNGKYVGVNDYGNKFAYSTDGINWTMTSSNIGVRWWYSICYGNGKYVALNDRDSFGYSDSIII